MGGSGGSVIVGDRPLVDEIEAHLTQVADFRREQVQDIVARYRANENSITRADQQYLLRAAADIVDHP
jgi:hypothetical protein